MNAVPDASMPQTPPDGAPGPRGLLARWHETPLYWRILGALILGVITGLMMGKDAEFLAIPSKLVLRVLGALAPPLILLAIVHALMTAEIKGAKSARLVGLLLLNTLVAICIGLLVANVIQPGRLSKITPPTPVAKTTTAPDLTAQMLDNVPKSLFGPLGDDGKVIGVIFIAIAFGMAFRKVRQTQLSTVEDVVTVLMESLITVLHWVIDVVPFAVFGIVASIIGTKGFSDFRALGMFVVAVLVALLLQALWYLTRVHFGSWVRPLDLLRGTRDALTMAFSTASSTITMPLTYTLLKTRVGVRDENASMGALVGANFNNDGTALYEAMSALFISQMIGTNLTLTQQILVVLTSVVASVGAAGIPEAGLVTMTLVFSAVGLPVEYIAILLTVDWFLDRCRTMINVMGDLNTSCLLDGKVRQSAEEEASSQERAPEVLATA